MSLTVTALKAQRRTTERVNLFVNGEFRCGVAYEIVVRELLSVGGVIDAATLERFVLADAKWQAKQSALSLLATRARATGELADRLRRKGYADEAVRHALTEVERMGLMDDMAFAEGWVRDRLLLRPRGARALVAELTRKRVAPDTARDAVARVMAREGVADLDLCAAAAGKWLRTRPSPAASDREERDRFRRRLAGYLGRRGFTGDAVRAALDRI